MCCLLLLSVRTSLIALHLEHQSLYLWQSGVLQNLKFPLFWKSNVFCFGVICPLSVLGSCTESPFAMSWNTLDLLPRRRHLRSATVCAQTYREFWLSLPCPWREWYLDTLPGNLQADDAAVELQIVLLPFIHVHNGDRALAMLYTCWRSSCPRGWPAYTACHALSPSKPPGKNHWRLPHTCNALYHRAHSHIFLLLNVCARTIKLWLPHARGMHGCTASISNVTWIALKRYFASLSQWISSISSTICTYKSFRVCLRSGHSARQRGVTPWEPKWLPEKSWRIWVGILWKQNKRQQEIVLNVWVGTW